MNLKNMWCNWWYAISPREMVKYWKYSMSAKAKVTVAKDGSYQMFIEGEKYPFPGFPRGVILVNGDERGFTKLSVLKHEVKNKIFNESWELLEQGKVEEIIKKFKTDGIKLISHHANKNRYDMLPYLRLAPAVKEIYRAFTVVAKGHEKGKLIEDLRDVITFILQEDDGYRFRVQWLAKFMPIIGKGYYRWFITGLGLMEHAEVVSDMRGRVVLLKRVLSALLEDPTIYKLFKQFCGEVNWKKVRLTKADKYYFRAKYFRCDYPEFQY